MRALAPLDVGLRGELGTDPLVPIRFYTDRSGGIRRGG